MRRAAQRSSLLQRTLGVFVMLSLALALFLWAGRSLLQRPVENLYLDSRRVAALQTFERAIVPMKSMRDQPAPNADLLRKKFDFCADPLKDREGQVSARSRRVNPCANVNVAEELACHITAINSRLNAMSGDRPGGVDRRGVDRRGKADRQNDGDRILSERYAVNVDKWAETIRLSQGGAVRAADYVAQGNTKKVGSKTQAAAAQQDTAARQPVACRDALGAARELAAGDARLLGLLAWRELSSKTAVALQFSPDQAVRVSARILEQRNPWGGVPGCIYYGDAGRNLLYVTDSRQSNRQACVAMRPSGTTEKDISGIIQRAAGGPRMNRVTQNNGALNDAVVPPAPPESLDVILADLDNIRLPWKDLYRAYTEPPLEKAVEKDAGETAMMSSPRNAGNAVLEGAAGKPIAVSHGPNQLARQKHKVDAGFNVHLTINPDSQHLVQQMSLCYAGNAAACRQIGLAGDKTFNDFMKPMYEKAAVRMAAVALIDIPTGRIEALGSAHTDCYRQEFDGPGRNARECPNLPSSPHYEPDRLLNHALYTDALPGSIIKPIMATGFLSDPAYRKKIQAERVSNGFIRLQDELKSSDSAAFLNRMFCIDRGWTNCQRPRDVQQAALLFGWDQGCAEATFRCGRINVLFGYPDGQRIREDTSRMPLGASVMFGRLLTESAAKRPADFQMMRNFSFEPRHAAACSRGEYYSGNSPNRGWRKCRHGRLVYLESEAWGQGNARTTALGAAGMFARLAAAANGQESLRLPYLVDRITDSQSRRFDLAAQQFGLADPVKLGIPQEDAALIVEGLVSHKAYGSPAGSRSGTAHVACSRVFDAATCNRIDWIAGKTGTPPYGNDGLTLKDIQLKCRAPAKNAADGGTEEWLTACSREQPYKWYVAAFKTDEAQSGFNKAVAVLTERNWYRSGPLAGKVQSPGDNDALNVSAEMAFRIMARMRTATGPAKAGSL